jgi:TolB-like protein/Tfp pilus assembly protein PilF
MTDIFISYAHPSAPQARQIAEALRALGYAVWWDEDLPAHRAYTDVIEERLRAAKAVVVVWSPDAVRSQWVRAEADVARVAGTLAQISVDGAVPPLPFNQIQWADLSGWAGELSAAGWRKVEASIAALAGDTAIRALAAAPPPAAPPMPGKPSIAVLPFANLSGDPEQDYFADGMVVEIVEALSCIRSIFVIASGSSLSFKGKGMPVQDIARQLGVRYMLEGNVRTAGGRVRIGVQLVDAESGAQIWTHRFEDTLDDVFALQDKVALSVAGVIEPTVQTAEIRRAAQRPTGSLGGYDLYLRALPPLRSMNRTGLSAARDLLDRAVEFDPEFGQALSLAAICRWLIVGLGWSTDPEADTRQSVALAHRALKAAGDDAKVLGEVAGVLAYLEHDLDGAIALTERALALNPSCAQALIASGGLRVARGDADVAVEHLERSLRLDPMGPDRTSQVLTLASAHFSQRRFEDALPHFKEAAQRSEESPGAYLALAANYGHLGQAAAAAEALARFQALSDLTDEAFLQLWSATITPDHLALFAEGLALARGPG